MGMRTGTSAERWGRAVVIGGGYAGLVTARVLTDSFREVVVLERDPVDADTGVHPHAPQAYHAHAMLAKGAEILAHCAESLASYKRPKSLDIVAELPRNTMGKLLKRELRDPYWKGRERTV